MISVSRLNGKEFYINPDMIEFLEKTPDTVVSLTTGKKVVVEESVEIIIEKIVEYRRRVFTNLPTVVARAEEDE